MQDFESFSDDFFSELDALVDKHVPQTNAGTRGATAGAAGNGQGRMHQDPPASSSLGIRGLFTRNGNTRQSVNSFAACHPNPQASGNNPSHQQQLPHLPPPQTHHPSTTNYPSNSNTNPLSATARPSTPPSAQNQLPYAGHPASCLPGANAVCSHAVQHQYNQPNTIANSIAHVNGAAHPHSSATHQPVSTAVPLRSNSRDHQPHNSAHQPAPSAINSNGHQWPPGSHQHPPSNLQHPLGNHQHAPSTIQHPSSSHQYPPSNTHHTTNISHPPLTRHPHHAPNTHHNHSNTHQPPHTVNHPQPSIHHPQHAQQRFPAQTQQHANSHLPANCNTQHTTSAPPNSYPSGVPQAPGLHPPRDGLKPKYPPVQSHHQPPSASQTLPPNPLSNSHPHPVNIHSIPPSSHPQVIPNQSLNPHPAPTTNTPYLPNSQQRGPPQAHPQIVPHLNSHQHNHPQTHLQFQIPPVQPTHCNPSYPSTTHQHQPSCQQPSAHTHTQSTSVLPAGARPSYPTASTFPPSSTTPSTTNTSSNTNANTNTYNGVTHASHPQPHPNPNPNPTRLTLAPSDATLRNSAPHTAHPPLNMPPTGQGFNATGSNLTGSNLATSAAAIFPAASSTACHRMDAAQGSGHQRDAGMGQNSSHSGAGSGHQRDAGMGQNPSRAAPGSGHQRDAGMGQNPSRSGAEASTAQHSSAQTQQAQQGHQWAQPGQQHAQQGHQGQQPQQAQQGQPNAQHPQQAQQAQQGQNLQQAQHGQHPQQGQQQAQQGQQQGQQGQQHSQPPQQAQHGPLYGAELSLYTCDKLLVKFSGFHHLLAQEMKGVAGAAQVQEGAYSWTVPLTQHLQFIKRLQSLKGLRLDVKDLPDVVQRLLKAASKAQDDSELYTRIQVKPRGGGETLEERMMPFQREGVKLALKAGGRILIGDEMGLGKTVQACALLKCYQAEWPVLVIAPSSLKEQWADAIAHWLLVPGDDILVVHTPEHQRQVKRRAFKILVLSYETVGKLKQDIEALQFKIVVVDESHYIKNHASARAKNAMPIIQSAKRAILLSGTPINNRAVEILTQLQSLLPSAKVSTTKFAERYCEPTPFSRTSGGKNLTELHRLLFATSMIRRVKKDVLTQLPPKRRQQVHLRLDAKALDELKRMSKDTEQVKSLAAQAAARGVQNVMAGLGQEKVTMITALRKQTAVLKIKAVQEYMDNLIEAEEKFLVFAHHRELMDGIEKACCRHKKKLDYIRIDGSTPPQSRNELVNKFQMQESCKVAVLSISAAGVGLTLTSASIVLFAELDWVPGNLQQAEDRAHRIGQACSVNIQYLLVRGSIDDIMWNAVQSKLSSVGQLLDGKENTMQIAATRQQLEPNQTTLKPFLETKGTAAAPGPDSQADAANTSSAPGAVLTPSKQASITSFFTSTSASKRPGRLGLTGEDGNEQTGKRQKV